MRSLILHSGAYSRPHYSPRARKRALFSIIQDFSDECLLASSTGQVEPRPHGVNGTDSDSIRSSAERARSLFKD